MGALWSQGVPLRGRAEGAPVFESGGAKRTGQACLGLRGCRGTLAASKRNVHAPQLGRAGEGNEDGMWKGGVLCSLEQCFIVVLCRGSIRRRV